jgi:PilZ domain-containing protein
MRLSAVLKVSTAGRGSLTGEETGKIDRRQSDRRSLTLSAIANPPSAGELAVVVRDISPRGLLIEAERTALSPGDVIIVDLPDKGFVSAQVAWVSGSYFGCQLDQTISPAAVSAALLKANPHGRQPVSPSESEGPAEPMAGRGIWPELSFAVPSSLSLLLWAVIGLVAYLIL